MNVDVFMLTFQSEGIYSFMPPIVTEMFILMSPSECDESDMNNSAPPINISILPPLILSAVSCLTTDDMARLILKYPSSVSLIKSRVASIVFFLTVRFEYYP